MRQLLERLSIAALSTQIARKDISPVEVFEYFFARYERLNPHVNAIVGVDADAARDAAQAAEKRALDGVRLGPLDGILIAVKDNLFMRGRRVTWGSRLYSDFKPDCDDIAIARLRGAGAVLFCTTNTPEFALNQ
jgi:Asp-tRNA(Asn)/Glu-tRNA(Gln) amidotransferase A subunit family amidase